MRAHRVGSGFGVCHRVLSYGAYTRMKRVLSDIRNLPLGQLNDAVTEPAISINRLKTIKQGLLLTALAQ